MFDLNGLHALITGASGGIGSAIARLFAQAGATVVLSGRREDALNELAQDIKSQCVVLPCDLAKTHDADSLVKRAEDAVGQIDILINNAGFAKDSLLPRMKDSDWEDVIDVNLHAGFRLARAALRGMIKRRFGRIIGISSVIGLTGNAGQANYAAAKAGMIGMSKSLAHEVASRNVTVNCIAPGLIDTAMTAGISSDMSSVWERIPMRRSGTPLDVAWAALYLASPMAGYVTGETIHVNGGMLMS